MRGRRTCWAARGANLAEMARLGLPVPPGFTITTAACNHFYRAGPPLPRRAGGAGRRAPGPGGGDHRQALRRARQPAAGVGALGRARVHARHDGHRAQPRPQRRDGGGSVQALGRPALRLRQLPPLHPDVLQRGAGPGARRLRGDPGGPQGAAGGHRRHRTWGRRLGAGGRRLQARGGARAGRALPAGAA